MAKLYFRHGAMGSSKTANLLMVDYNYAERNQKALVIKPRVDDRFGKQTVKSRMGINKECLLVEDFVQMSDETIKSYDCILVDEAQFVSKAEVEFFTYVVDELNVPVICYGLRTDFQRNLFEGSMWLLAWADTIEEIKTICWCGRKAICNARLDENGQIIRSGEQVVMGSTGKYVALCRKHHKSGETGNLPVLDD